MTEPPQKYQATDDRKRAIAAAARSLIVEKGFEGLRTREIADRVGINIATLHYHIPTKDALVELVAQSMKEDFMAQRLQHQPGEDLSPSQRLRFEFDGHFRTRRENPELLLVMEEMSRRARHDDTVARVILPMRDFWFERIRAVVAAGCADGSFRSDLDPPSATLMIIGLMIATSAYRIEDREVIDRAVDELFRSILSAPQERRADA
ncbi:MAG: TetR/AcrR family transcriptional regulator [Rhizobium sp.]|nr:TetR/AcrR family transcriptional regulator [Rhizobium sp.]